MDIKILCIGDVVGRPGRHVLSQVLAPYVKQHAIDCVVANVENAAGGSGLTAPLYEKFLRYGVDVMTLGDHAFKRMDIVPVLKSSERVIRPANFQLGAAGKGVTIFTTPRGPRIAVINLIGRLYMKLLSDCPYLMVDRLIAELPEDVKIVVVDFHAEATGEKVAMGWHLDGRASVVFGTHTHVPTADECVLPKGTAYISDVGMTGPYDSILGRRTDRVLGTLLSGMPSPFDVAEGDARMCGIVTTIDSETGRATSIERVRMDDPGEAGAASDADV